MKRMKLFSLFVAFGMAFAVVSPTWAAPASRANWPGCAGLFQGAIGPINTLKQGTEIDVQ